MTMILWCIFALMTAAAIFAVVWPLGRKPSERGGGSELVVYKDQLREIDRDRAAGLIGETEAETARLEVSRRLLAAADTQPPRIPSTFSQPMLRRRRAVAIAALIILPFGPPSLYIALGSPNIPWAPAFARVDTGQGASRSTIWSVRSRPISQATPMMAPAGKLSRLSICGSVASRTQSRREKNR